MEKQAVPAGQLVPDFLFCGASKNLKVEKYDPERREEAARRGRLSRRLRDDDARAEQPLHQRREDRAGDRADADRAAAIDDQGRDDAVERLISRRPRISSSRCMLLGWGTETGETSSSLRSLLMTFNQDKGCGTANRGRYSNPAVDALIEDALVTDRRRSSARRCCSAASRDRDGRRRRSSRCITRCRPGR